MIEPDRPLLERIADGHPRPLLFATVSGAHLYGFPSPDSDFDLRGVHLMSADELLGLRGGRETIEQAGIVEGREIDLVTHDVRKFMRLMLKCNGYVLEQLFSPLVVRASDAHAELLSLGRACVTRGHVRHYLGFAENQWKLFRKESAPRAKPLLYVYRVLLTGIHMMRTGEVEANLLVLNKQFRLPYIDDLVQRKTGGTEKGVLDGADMTLHEREFARLLEVLEDAGRESRLPVEPLARPGLEDLLVRLRTRTVSTD